ncbi:hypothetical protein ACWCQE_27805 [Streptomyces sp. NPDC002409]
MGGRTAHPYRWERDMAETATKATTTPEPTPADVTRADGVTISPDGHARWSVERGQDFLGVIWDEGPEMARGRFAAWSPFAPARNGVAGFFADPDEAVEVIVGLWPTSPADIARETGAPLADVISEADALAEELERAGGRVYRTAIRGAAARLTNEAAAAVRERLALPAARYTVEIGPDERTWPQFHSHAAALRCAASYGLSVDAVRDGTPALGGLERCTPIAGGRVHEVSGYKGPDGEGLFPLCRTGSADGRGARYRKTSDPLSCRSCLENERRRKLVRQSA